MKRINATKKRGVFLLDICVGVVIISVVMVILMQAVFQLGEHRKDQRFRQIGADTLLNVNELLDGEPDLAQPETETFQQRLGPLRKMVANALPEGKLEIVPLPVEADESLRLIKITLSYDRGKTLPRRELSLLRLISVAK